MSVKTDCRYYEYDRDGNEHYDMCEMHPEKLYGVEAKDCEDCNYYSPHSYCGKQIEINEDGSSHVKENHDSVNHPDHYTHGGIECIDAIRASLGCKEFAGYCKGNVIRYVWRYRHKNGVEDLKKAKVYLDWMIEAERESGNET